MDIAAQRQHLSNLLAAATTGSPNAPPGAGGLNIQDMLAAMGASGGRGGMPPMEKKKKKKSSNQAPRSGIMTMDALRNQGHSDEEDSSDEDENQGQAFYAGGSQSSGQQVLGPPKTRDQIVADMFKKARE